MTDDIVTRLRQKYGGQLPICTEAADEIERLRAECDRWHDVANSLATHIEKTSSGNARALQEYDNMVYKAVYRD